MITLLTEEQNLAIHKDSVSGRCNIFLGDIRYNEGLGYAKLVEKIIWEINKCPHCGSLNSFHRRQNDPENPNRNALDNVYRIQATRNETSGYLHKIDYCLDCHKEFSIELYGWKKLTIAEEQEYAQKNPEEYAKRQEDIEQKRLLKTQREMLK